MNYLEIAGTLAGVVYLWLEYRASAWLWVASIVMPAIYLKVYYDAGLYADFGISVYYIVASVYGLVYWLRHRDDEPGKEDSAGIIPTPRNRYLPILAAFTVIFVVIGLILSRLTDSTVPWADAFTTALSIVALWMLARKYVEQWLVWIAADVAMAILYAYKGLWLTGGLYLAYAVVAVAGYLKWKSMMNEDEVYRK